MCLCYKHLILGSLCERSEKRRHRFLEKIFFQIYLHNFRFRSHYQLRKVTSSSSMAKHHPDLIFCRKQAGVAIGKCLVDNLHNQTQQIFAFPTPAGRLCEKCDGKCVICDSYVRPCTLVRICDECNYGSYQVIFYKNIL